MEKILVSACLLGLACAYDGKPRTNKKVVSLAKEYCLVPVCPEQLGGLPTPRKSCGLTRDGRVVSVDDGEDLTEAYLRGARGAPELARFLDIKRAILKARSPSCGKGVTIYTDGKKLWKDKGNGVFAGLLLREGIEVLTDEEL